MANRDLGTAVLNIKILFEKLTKKNVKEQLQKSVQTIEEVFKTATDKVSKNVAKADNLNQVKARGKAIGEALNQGIIVGVTNSIAGVISKIRENSQAIEKAAKDSLGIASPSKKFIKVGEDIIAGLIVGIETSVGPAKAVMKKYLDQITNVTNEIGNLKAQMKAIEGKPLSERTKEDAVAYEMLSKALRNAKLQLKDLQKEAKTRLSVAELPKGEVEKEKRLDKAKEAAAAKLKMLAGGYRAVQANIDSYVSSLKLAGNTTANYNAALEATKQSVGKFFGNLVASAAKTKDFSAASSDLATQLNKIQVSIGKSLPDGKMKRDMLAALSVEYDKAAAAIKKMDDAEKAKAQEKKDKTSERLKLQAKGVTEVSQKLRNLDTQLQQSNQRQSDSAAAVKSARLEFDKLNKGVVQAAKSNKDFMAGQAEIIKLEKQLKIIVSGISDKKVRKDIYRELRESALTARSAIHKLRVEEETRQTKTQDKAISGMAKQGRFATKLGDAIKSLNERYEKSKDRAESFNTAVSALNQTFNTQLSKQGMLLIKNKEFSKAAKELKKEYELLTKAIKASIQDPQLQSRAIDAALAARRKALREMGRFDLNRQGQRLFEIDTAQLDRRGLNNVRNMLQKLRSDMIKLGGDTSKLDKMLVGVDQKIAKLDSNRLANIRRGIHTVTSGVNQFGEQLRRVSFILRDVGRQMMMMARRGFSIVKNNAKDFMEFEQAVVDILAVTGELNVGLERTGAVSSDLGKFILDLAGKTRFSAKEIAEAGKTLALAGLSTEQIKGALKSMTALAAATGSELSATTTLIVSTISTFQIEAEKAGKVADIFAAAVTKSNMSVVQLSEAMKIVAPSAAAMGQSISQTAAALGVLANAGLRGSMAGTGLSRILTQLVEKADMLDGMLQGLGSSFEAINPEKVGIVDIVKEFERLNLSTGQLLQIFDLRAFRSFQAILAQGSTSLDNLNQSLEASAGLAELLAVNRLKTLKGAFDLLSDSVSALKIQIGELISDDLKKFVKFLTSTIESIRDAVTGNSESFKAVTQTILGFIAVVGALGTTLFTVGSAFAFAAAPIIAGGAALAAFNSLISAAVTLVLGLGPAVITLGGAIGGITVGFAAAGAAITAFTAAIAFSISALSVGIFQNFDLTFAYLKEWVSSFFKFFGKFVDDFTKGWNSGFDEFRTAFEGVLTALTRLGMDLSDLFKGDVSESIGKILVKSFTSALEMITKFINYSESIIGLGSGLVDVFIYIGESISSFGGSSIKLLVVLSYIADALEYLIGLFAQILPSFDSFVTWATAVGVTLTAWVGIPAIITAITAAFSALFSLLLANPFVLIISAIVAAMLLLDRYVFGVSAAVDKARKKVDEAIADSIRLKERLDQLARESIAIEVLNVKGVSQATAGVTSELDKRIELLKNAATTSSKDLAKLLSPADFQKVLGLVNNQLSVLVEARDALAKKAKDAAELGFTEEAKKYSELLEQLNKQIITLEASSTQYARSLDLVSLAMSGNTDEINNQLNAEAERLDRLNKAADGFSRVAAGITSKDAFDAFRIETGDDVSFFGPVESLRNSLEALNEEMGTDFELNTYEDFQAIVEYLAKEGKEATDNSRELVETLKAAQALSIDQGGFDLATEEGRAARDARAAELRDYLETAKQQSKESEHMKELEKIRNDLAEQGLSEHQKSLKALDEEIEKRFKIATNQREYLRLQSVILENELKSTQLTEDQREAKEAALKTTRAELEAATTLVDQLSEADALRRKEMIQARQSSVEKIIDELRLETETDIAKRIEIRTRLATQERDRQLAEARKEMQGLFGDELKAREDELEAANRAALAQDIDKIKAEEMKDVNGDNNKVVDKRLDLETELLNNLGKQVTSLQQMAALMQFIEALQRRKDRKALQDIGKLAKAREKLNRLEKLVAGGGEKGDKAMLALQRAQDEFAFLGGIVERGAGMAGVPKAVQINANALMGNLVVSLDNLTKAIKDFKPNKALAGIIPGGLNIGGGNRLVGANFGTINHIDNSIKNITIKTNNPKIAKDLST